MRSGNATSQSPLAHLYAMCSGASMPSARRWLMRRSLSRQPAADAGLARWNTVQMSCQPEATSIAPSGSRTASTVPLTADSPSQRRCSLATSISSASLYPLPPMLLLETPDAWCRPHESDIGRAVLRRESERPLSPSSGGRSLISAQNTPRCSTASMNDWKSTGLTT